MVKSNSAYPLFSFYNRFCCNSTNSSISMRNSHGVYAAVLTCTVLQYNEHLKVKLQDQSKSLQLMVMSKVLICLIPKWICSHTLTSPSNKTITVYLCFLLGYTQLQMHTLNGDNHMLQLYNSKKIIIP